MSLEREVEALQREVKELREQTAGIPVRWASGGGGAAGEIIFGRLTSSLTPGSSATMTTYHPDTSATLETGVTVYHVLATGSVLASGTWVFVSKLKSGGSKKYVIGRFC